VRIAIADHLDGRPACRVEADDLPRHRQALRARRVEEVAAIGLNRLQADIIERWDGRECAVERDRNLFDDPRRASTSLGISVIASLCLAFCAFVLAQSPIRHPESLKAVMTQSERARMTDIDLPEAFVELPRANPEAVMPATVVNRDGDEEVAFAALVTEHGDLQELEYLGRIRAAIALRPTSSCRSS
jgi:hypothetical protein